MSDQQPERQDQEAAMLEVLQALREDPDRYRGLRRALTEAESDEERVRTLLRFATSEEELAALIPARVGEPEALAWTTVTVTTVFIPDSAY
jgi:hypothetical protein